MKKNSVVNVIILIVLLCAAIWYLYPSFNFYSKTEEQRYQLKRDNPEITKKILNLGLDLQGGLRLVLEVDRSNIPKDAQINVLDRAYAVIENRINQYGTFEPVIQKQGQDRLIVELPGVKNREEAISLVKTTAQLQFNLVREQDESNKAMRIIERVVSKKKLPGDEEVTDSTKTDSTKNVTDTSVIKNKEAQKDAEQLFAGNESKKDTSAKAGVDSVDEDSDLFEETSFISLTEGVAGSAFPAVELKNIPKVDTILARKDVQDALIKGGLQDNIFLWSHEIVRNGSKEYKNLYYLKKKPELTGDIITNAGWEVGQGQSNSGQYIVNLEMNNKGAKKFARVTGVNVNKCLAIVLDNTVYSAPVIRQKITGGRAMIEGSFTMEEAKALSIVLTAGALPAPVKIIEERTVGPSLGTDSIKKVTWAMVMGSLLIIIFMIIYYKQAGLFANIAVIVNIVMVLAAMATFGATLTLPGVAGLLLTLGMAVDANVLIYERIREELATGKTVRSAVDVGYSRAFITIMDANITTLLTQLILLWVGTGAIKGFAVTMSLGILATLYTAIILTRMMFNVVTASNDIKKLSI